MKDLTKKDLEAISFAMSSQLRKLYELANADMPSAILKSINAEIENFREVCDKVENIKNSCRH